MQKDYFINIDGQDVPIRVNLKAYGMYRYYFKRNLMQDLNENITQPAEKQHWKKDLERNTKLAQIIWVFAKNANSKLPLFEDWLETVNELPVRYIIPQILGELIMEKSNQGKLKRFFSIGKNILLKQ